MIKQTLYTGAGSCLVAAVALAIIGWGADTVHATDHMSKEEAGKIVTDKYGGDVLNVEEESDGAIYEVEVEDSDEGRIEVDVDAAEGSGDILEVEYEDKDDETFIISGEEAEEAAMDKYGGNVKETEIEHEEDSDGNYVLVYEVELRGSNEGDIEVDVDAHSGDLFDSEQEDGDDDKVSFPDVKKVDSGYGSVGGHYDAIMSLAKKGIIKGREDGKFHPWDNISRGQIANMLVKAQDLETPGDIEKALSGYDDVGASSDYADSIAATTEAGIFSGYDGIFGVYDDLTREQMATVLVRTFDLDVEDTGGKVKVNLDNVGKSHRDAVQTLANLGITTELDDFHAYDPVNRAQVATFLDKAVDQSS